jgi:hypothetical protein
MVALVECGTHAVVDAELDGCRVGETTLAVRVARSAGPGMLVLPRPGVPGGAVVACDGGHRGAAAVAGAGQPGPGRRAGAARRVLAACACPRRATGLPGGARSRVRVVADALDDPGRAGAGEYRLVTDLLDHQRYPADELAALYARRWEEETALDELKTHQRGPGLVLASTSKTLTASASRSGPTCWSTTPCARRGAAPRRPPGWAAAGSPLPIPCVPCGAASPPRRGWFPPERLVRALVWLRDDLLAHLLPTRRLRSQPCVVNARCPTSGQESRPPPLAPADQATRPSRRHPTSQTPARPITQRHWL